MPLLSKPCTRQTNKITILLSSLGPKALLTTAFLILATGCATQVKQEAQSPYTVQFGVISQPSITPITVDKSVDVVHWQAGVSEPFYGVQIRKHSNDTYEVYFEVYRKGDTGYRLIATSPTYLGYGEQYNCEPYNQGCHGTLLQYRKGKALKTGSYKYRIYVDKEELEEVKFDFFNADE